MTTVNEREIRELIASTWWVPLTQGIVALMLGIWAFTRTGQTLATILFLFGLYWLINGIFTVIAAVSGRIQQYRTWQLVGGILSIVAGSFAVSQPFMAGIFSASLVGTLIGLSSIFSGITQILVGRMVMRTLGADWSWSNFFHALLNIIFGIIVIANPVMTVTILIQIFAMIAIVGGLALLYSAWRIRSLAK